MKRVITNPLIKDTATFIKTAAETGGKVSEIEITLMPGGGNPFHYHTTYEETFTAMDGELGLQAGKDKKKLILKPGEKHTVIRQTLHRFFNPGDKPIKFKIEITPGHEGFENSLRIIYGMAGDGLTNKKSVPKKLRHIAIVGIMSDMRVPGVLSLLEPVFVRMAAKAKANGEEQMLIEKYCK